MASDIAKKLFDELKDEETDVPPSKEPLKVFLRIRPLTDGEKKSKEDQGCVVRKGEDVVELCAPPSSFTFKSSNRGFNDTTHQFSFSHIFPESTSQKDFFDQTMLPFVKDILNGVNGLVFTYGVTNSGKTYTFQGTPKDGGILPRSLDVIFNSISSKKYVYPNIKPKFCNEVTYLSKEDESKEENIRQHLFTHGAKDNEDMTFMKRLNSTTKLEKTVVNSRENSMFPDISMIHKVGSESNNADIEEEIRSRITDDTNIEMDTPTGVKFGMWVSFIEIYNELIHDLLQITTYGTGKKRQALKLGEDKNGNPYVRGLTEVFVTSSDEAYKVLRVGQKNKHMAATKLNQNSSRSHSIFTIKLMKIVDGVEPRVSRISRLSIVDLAGSERYTKTDAYGMLLKEASNINCSIMTLGKCISTLRYNQEHQNHPTIVPFRESKLTRLFQCYFRGKGKASMVVNISPCASVFDETYNVLKFSSVAKEIKMKAERNTEIWQIPPVPKLLATPKPQGKGPPCTPVQKRPPLCIVTPSTQPKKDRSLNNPNDFNYNELVCIVKELNEKIKKERKEKAALERTIRGEITKEMESVLKEVDESHRNELIEQKDSMNQLMESRLDLLTKTVEKQRKRKRLRDENDDSSESGTSGTSSVYIEADKMKVAEMEEKLERYRDHIHAIEDENGKLRKLEKDFRDLEETYKMQNKSIKEMQKKLEAKDDQIEKLLEEMEDSQTISNVKQDKIIKELEKELREKDKEIQIAKANLENRDVHIQQLETKRGDADYCERLKAQLDELNQKLKDVEESAALVQFESDEKKFQLEKYESVLKEQQETLEDSENIILQLNENLFILKSQLAQEQLKHSYEAQQSLEVGVNASVNVPEKNSFIEENAKITPVITEKSLSDVACNTSILKDECSKPQTIETGINTSIINNDPASTNAEKMEVQVDLEVNEVMTVHTSSKISLEKDNGKRMMLENTATQPTVSDACVSTSFVKEESVEVGVNTSLVQKEVLKSDTATNTSLNMEVNKTPSAVINRSVDVSEESPMKPLIGEIGKQFITPPCQKIEVQNEIESIEGFRLEVKSISKVKQMRNNTFEMTPERLFSPKNRKTRPSCSPRTLQQTISQFEKLLDDAKKDVEKKSSLLTSKNNHILHLENQLAAYEKKQSSQKAIEGEKVALENQVMALEKKLITLENIVEEKTALENQLCSLEDQLSSQKIVEEEKIALENRLGILEDQLTAQKVIEEEKTTLENQVMDLEDRLNSQKIIEEEKMKLESKLSALENQLIAKTVFEEEKTALENQVRDLEEKLNSQNAVKEEKIALENKIKALEDHLAAKIAIEEEKTALENQVRDLEEKLNSQNTVEEEKIALENKIKALEDHLAAKIAIEEEKTALENQVRDLEDKLNSRNTVEEEKIDLENKIKALEDHLAAKMAIEEEKTALENQVKNLEEKLSFKNNIEEEKEALEDKLSALEGQLTEQKVIEEEKATLTNQIASLSKDVISLSEQLQEKVLTIESKNDEINVWIIKTEEVQSELNKAFNEISEFEGKLQLKEKECKDTCTIKNEKMQTVLDKALLEISGWEDKLKVKEQESQELLDGHLSKISLLTNDKMELLKEMEPLKVALGKLEAERKQYIQEASEHLKSIENFETQVTEMRKVINLKSADLDTCQKQMTEKENLLLMLQKEKENVLTETTKLNKELKDRRKSRVASQTMMKSSLENYKEQVITLQKENEENLEEISSLKLTIVEVQSKCNNMESCFNEANSAKELLAKSEAALIERLEDMKLKLSQSEVEVRKLNSANTKQETKFLSLEAEKEKVKASLSAEIDSLKKDLQELSTKNEEILSDLKDVRKSKQELTVENEDKLDIIEKLKEEKVECEGYISSLNSELDQLRVDNVELENVRNEFEELKEKYDEQERRVIKLETERDNHLESSEVMKETYLKKIEELEVEKSEIKSKVERLENEKKTFYSNKDTVSKELDELKNDLIEKQSYIKTLINEKEDFLKKISEIMESMKEEKKNNDIKLEKMAEYEKEKKENLALIETLQLNVREIATTNEEYLIKIKAFESNEQGEKSLRRTPRRSKRSTAGTKKITDESISSNTSDVTEISSILPSIDETESNLVDQGSTASSPLPSLNAASSFLPPKGLESTRCEPNLTLNDETSSRATPVSKKKKRLHMLTCTMFETSPDGIERLTGNEKEINNATMPMSIKGRRVTRSTRSSIRSSTRK